MNVFFRALPKLPPPPLFRETCTMYIFSAVKNKCIFYVFFNSGRGLPPLIRAMAERIFFIGGLPQKQLAAAHMYSSRKSTQQLTSCLFKHNSKKQHYANYSFSFTFFTCLSEPTSTDVLVKLRQSCYEQGPTVGVQLRDGSDSGIGNLFLIDQVLSGIVNLDRVFFGFISNAAFTLGNNITLGDEESFILNDGQKRIFCSKYEKWLLYFMKVKELLNYLNTSFLLLVKSVLIKYQI